MLQRAIRRLRAGLPLPLDMTFALLAEGHDVGALERRYGV